MVANRSARALSVVRPERRAALVVRVSTDHQVRNEEGSLKTQLQRLRQHMEYKNGLGENWIECEVYELKAISGKDSIRSQEFKRLFDDIASGRVNTVMFTALSRLSRSVRDFLQFVEFLDEHDANFVSLKEDYDTTSAHGRLIMTIVMALAEFEREQTSERTKDAFVARTQRGLWNGSRIFGYDLDPTRKGYLVPNASEAAVVNFAFDTYLELGSLSETAEAMTSAGYRTKAYRSRREVEHQAKPFTLTTVQHMLKNISYIAKKKVEDGSLVDAVWPAIVSTDKFGRVQQLMTANGRSNRSQAHPLKHCHLLSRGLMRCGRCGESMQGKSGTGRSGTTYFYYSCLNRDCGMRANASEVESAVLARIGQLAANETVIGKLVAEADRQLKKQVPELEKRLRAQRRSLSAARGRASKLLSSDVPLEGRSLLQAELLSLTVNCEQLEVSSARVERELAALRSAAVDPAVVVDGLRSFGRVVSFLKPFEQRDLVRSIIAGVELGDRELVLEIREGACTAFAQTPQEANSPRFAGLTNWLPDEDSNLEHRG